MITEEEWSRQIAKAVREYLQQHTVDLLEKVDTLLATRQRKWANHDSENRVYCKEISVDDLYDEYTKIRNAVKGLMKGGRT